MTSRMQQRRDTAANWTTNNPTLAAGELGFETDTGKFKIGNGSSTWTALSYASGGEVGDITGVTVSNGIAGTSLTGPVPALTLATTAKGDLLAGTGSNTAQALAVGANATVLTADSTTATGLKWAAAFAGKTSNNKILNGDFFINQRDFTSNTADGAYNFDRFLQKNSGGSCTVTPQTFTLGTAPVAGYEATNFLQSITASQSAAGDFAYHSQRIENVRSMAGQSVVISFWAKANTGTPKVGVQLVQNFGSGGSPSAEVSTPISAITLSTSWARYEVTVLCPSITGKTIGSTANTSYLAVNLWQSAGANFATQSSTTGIQNFTLQLWGVQLESGTIATSFAISTGTTITELLSCQRYYLRWGNNGIAGQVFAVSSGGDSSFFGQTVTYIVWVLAVKMRAAPTFGQSGAFQLFGGPAGAGNNITSWGGSGVLTTPDSVYTTAGLTTAIGANPPPVLRANSDGAAKLTVSAEL